MRTRGGKGVKKSRKFCGLHIWTPPYAMRDKTVVVIVLCGVWDHGREREDREKRRDLIQHNTNSKPRVKYFCRRCTTIACLQAVKKWTSETLLYSWCMPAPICASAVQQHKNGKNVFFFPLLACLTIYVNHFQQFAHICSLVTVLTILASVRVRSGLDSRAQAKSKEVDLVINRFIFIEDQWNFCAG